AVKQRVSELAQGKKIPVVIFNCIDFTWEANKQSYPKARASSDTSNAITSFFGQDITKVMSTLQTLGNAELVVVVPDSELLDSRAFSFAQEPQDRKSVGEQIKQGLERNLQQIFDQVGGRVVYWSEYCAENGLPSPLSYTAANFERIQANPKLEKKVRDQVKDSRKYFERLGLPKEQIDQIPQEEIETYVRWYLAMYAGEGEALADANALVLMPEDGRVPAWFVRGAEGAGKELAMIRPVNPLDYFQGRRRS
ncbi:MAG: hypothetical protein KGJ07_09900, partial [Patescibacteria group bacterium]|nr:hypothetical protein [Patescibacteria group bacterium]